MSQDSIVVFVCEHGAAKSVIATAYFNKLASEKSLDVHAVARGTNPDDELSPNALAGLGADGLHPTELIPQKLSMEDVESAQRIISFCILPVEYQTKAMIDEWNNIPSVSENYEKARDAILERLNWLINEI